MRELLAPTNFESQVLTRKRIIVRDDQISWIEALDLAAWLAARKKTFVLIDTGRFSSAELEWLLTRKTILVSYPEAGRSWSELLLLKKVAGRAGKPVIFGYHGSETGEKLAEIYSNLLHLGRGGVDLHLSGKAKNLEAEALSQLAAHCRGGRSWFVYYHYGPLETWLNQLAKEGAWIHLSDRFFDPSQVNNLEEFFKSFPRSVQVVIHIEDERRARELIDMVNQRKGFLVFSRPPLLSFFEKSYQVRKALPFRAYHLESRALF